jgi:hypothetical protein
MAETWDRDILKRVSGIGRCRVRAIGCRRGSCRNRALPAIVPRHPEAIIRRSLTVIRFIQGIGGGAAGALLDAMEPTSGPVA